MKFRRFLTESANETVYMIIVNNNKPTFDLYDHDATAWARYVKIFTSDKDRADYLRDCLAAIIDEDAMSLLPDLEDDEISEVKPVYCLDTYYEDRPDMKDKIENMTSYELKNFFNESKMRPYGFNRPLSQLNIRLLELKTNDKDDRLLDLS